MIGSYSLDKTSMVKGDNMKLVFSSIKNGTIFESDFQMLNPGNGTIEFKHMNSAGGIAVIYAPNGTGKSSLTRVVEAEDLSDDLSYAVVDDDGTPINPGEFHIIPDQINRDVIRGKETDYLIGAQIKREYQLRDQINNAFDIAYKTLEATYKSEFKVTKVGDFLLDQISTLQDEPYPTAYKYIHNIVNKKYHGRSICQADFVSFIRNNKNKLELNRIDSDKKAWIVDDCSGKANIVKRLIELDCHTIVPSIETIQLEQHDDAIGILRKYHSLDTCIVCDNHNFHGDELLEMKQNNRKRIYDELDSETKKLLDNVVRESGLETTDPFDIKRIVGEFIAGGDESDLLNLQKNLMLSVHAIGDEMIDILLHCFDDTSLFENFDEYNSLVAKQPELDSEELLFIEDVINESIGKDITIERETNNNRNYKLKLGGKDLLNTSRASMELSSGEQNFVSLAFELLLARHSSKDYVVLDDPISSFDSIYKNKIAFCIIKFLDQKKQIVLTHNMDLIHLLDVQLNNCFNLYLLNNSVNGQNGFIRVNEQEKKLLINLHELIKLFQNKVNKERGDTRLVPAIRNRRHFLMSMIPFIRGYSHISLDKDDDFGTLSSIMHGYNSGSVDVVPIYNKYFGYDFGGSEVITVDDVINLDCNKLDIIDETSFPLLSETLKQTLIYYHIRMKVEKGLVEAFNIPTHDMDTLNQIIRKAFPESRDVEDERNRKLRVFFTSRKTLINEFNHFEGNMNLFQPAIDINPTALRKEIKDIEIKLDEAKSYAAGLCS